MAPITGNTAGALAYAGNQLADFGMGTPATVDLSHELPGTFSVIPSNNYINLTMNGTGYGDVVYTDYSTSVTTGAVYQNTYPYIINGTMPGAYAGTGNISFGGLPISYAQPKRPDRLTCRLKVPNFGRHHMPDQVNLPELEQSMKKLAAKLLSKALPKERILFQPGRRLSLEEIKGDQSPVEFLIPAQTAPIELTVDQVVLESVEDTKEGRIFVFSHKPDIEHSIDVEITEDIIQECIKMKKLALVKHQIHKNLKPVIHEHLKNNMKQQLPMTAVQANEIKARETLRDMITEAEWRRYVTNGFVMVKAPSGLWYQIFKDMQRIRVYKNNQHVESLCIYTDRQCPPSDHVINMKLMIEMDEMALRQSANVYPAGKEGDALYGRGARHQNDIQLALQAPATARTRIVKPATPKQPTLVEMYKQLTA